MSYEFLRTIWRGDLPTLDRELERLVDSGLMQRLGDGDATVYAFKHALVQDVAYDSLLRSVRLDHHQAIAEALEERFLAAAARPPPRSSPTTSARPGCPSGRSPTGCGRASGRWSARPTTRPSRTSPPVVELLGSLPASRERDELELAMLVRLGAPLMATRGYGSAEVEEVYRRALALGDGLGDMTQLFEALYGIFRMHLLRAEYFVALDVADRLVALAARSDRPELKVAASRAVGSVLVYCGDDKAEALRALQHAIATDAAYGDSDRRGPALNDVADAAVASQAYAAWTLWLQDRTDEANAMSDAAVAHARALGHPFTLALALSFDSWLRQFQGDVAAVRARADEVWTFAIEQGFGFWIGWASIMRGWATAGEGDLTSGAGQIRQGLVDWQATGSQLGTTYFLALLADVLGQAGEVRAGARHPPRGGHAGHREGRGASGWPRSIAGAPSCWPTQGDRGRRGGRDRPGRHGGHPPRRSCPPRPGHRARSSASWRPSTDPLGRARPVRRRRRPSTHSKLGPAVSPERHRPAPA